MNASSEDGSEVVKEMQPELVTKRPMVITILCLFMLWAAFSGIRRIITDYYFAWSFPLRVCYTVCFLLLLISYAGFWSMRRWSLILYVAVIAFNTILSIGMNIWQPQALILPVVVISIVLYHFRAMK